VGEQHVYADVVRDPSGLLHPFLTGGSFFTATKTASPWNTLCVFRPDLPSTQGCGDGFIAIDVAPTSSPEHLPIYRETGGFVQDLDGDGWDDVTLLFHGMMLAVSPAKREVIDSLSYNVGPPSALADPRLVWFHSGRNYGTDTAAVAKNGDLRVDLVGGAPVGRFVKGTPEQEYCAVSRYVAVVTAQAGQPLSRRLAWSRYISFNSAIFESPLKAEYASDPRSVVIRAGDFVNGCVNRFGDSRAVVDGRVVIAVDQFSGAPDHDCLAENYAVTLAQFEGPAVRSWDSCLASNAGSAGTWGLRVFAEDDGKELASLQAAYVWGVSNMLTPSGSWVFLVEPLPPSVPFDISDLPTAKIVAMSLVGGTWQTEGTFPLSGRPAIRSSIPHGNRGNGDGSPYADLFVNDVDADGLLDVRLESGVWVGWSKAKHAFAVKQ
jgi:hypothetical protein